MKTNCSNKLWLALAAAIALATATAGAQEEFRDFTNRVSLSARLGFNISARFTTPAGLAFPANTRTTPDGATYNYDDGYVLPSALNPISGLTWNWGYDSSAAQIVGNTIGMSRSTTTGAMTSGSMSDSPQMGAELVYSRQLGRLNHDKWRWGVEGAVNFLNLALKDSGGYSGPANRTTDYYPFTPGTTPPAATPAAPYQGTFAGPNFVIGDTPVSTVTGLAPNVVTVGGNRQFDATMFGFRLGPYLEIPLNTNHHLTLSLSGGLAGGFLSCDASWAETITFGNLGSVASTGNGSDTALKLGGYVAANLEWRFKERWSAIGGVQFQTLGNYEHNFGGRSVEVNLNQTLFVTLGLGYSF